MTIKIDNYNALTIMSFLMEFEEDFANREECTTIRAAVKEYIDQVCIQIPEDELDTIIKDQLHADRLLGLGP